MKKASDLRIPFTWENRRPVLLDRAIYVPGYYDGHDQWGQLDWGDIFGNDKPVIIEFCCGNGQWIGEQAKKEPHINWVGVDKLFERARKVWAKLHRENIPNLFVACAEASTFCRYYVRPNSVHRVHINFPDPWPKLKHAKHRLMRKEFFAELAWILEPGGEVHFASDDFPYVEWTLKEFSKTLGWMPLYQAPYYISNIEEFGSSFFKDLWLQQGKTIYHLAYRRL